MSLPIRRNTRLLLIDTCGATSGVALCEGEHLLSSEDLVRGNASAGILQAVHRLLESQSWRVQDLNCIGVVRGPGSFTGIRAGLAVAKGLCETLKLPLAAVSRLEVLADAVGLRDGLAALDAGRGELYVRDAVSGREWLTSIETITTDLHGRSLALAEARVAQALAIGEKIADSARILRPLQASDALLPVLRRLRESGDDVSLVDANYVCEEENIYQNSGAPRHAQAVR